MRCRCAMQRASAGIGRQRLLTGLKAVLPCLLEPILRIPLLLPPLLATDVISPDYSGIYDCTGNDAHEGPYMGTVTIERIAAQSTDESGAYGFQLEVPDCGTYQGQAAAHGAHMGIFFTLTDPTSHDFGTGTATFGRNAAGK